MDEQARITERYRQVARVLDERGRRAVAAAEALAYGWGGITVVARAVGLSRSVIALGIKERRGAVPSARRKTGRSSAARTRQLRWTSARSWRLSG